MLKAATHHHAEQARAPRHRILHLVTSLEQRGAQLFARRLANHLQSDAFDNRLFSLSGDLSDAREWAGGLPVETARSRSDVFSRRSPIDLRLTWEVRQAIRRSHADIVVAHGAETLKYGATAKLAFRSRRLVYLNIGLASFWANSKSKVLFNKALLRFVDRVVSVSKTTQSDFLRHYGFATDRSVHIPNGVEAADFDVSAREASRHAVRTSLGIEDDAPVLVSVGSLTFEKNQHEMVNLTAALHKLGTQAHLMLAGQGPIEASLRCSAKDHGIGSFVHFLGVRSDVPHVLNAADVFLMTSTTEGMPAVLIEAGLAGLPVVAYDVGGVSEVVDDGVTGWLVPFADSARLTERARHLLTNERGRSSFAEAARSSCEERFTMDVVAHQYSDLFQTLIAKPRQARSQPA